MVFFTPRIPSVTMVILGLSAVASVYAQPIREVDSAHVLEPRDPRIIPDTETYLSNILSSLGVGNTEPDVSTPAANTPTPTPTPTIKNEQEQAVNSVATSASSSSSTSSSTTTSTPTSTGQDSTFTTVIHNGNDKPIKNIQIGAGWDGKKELRASDLPQIFDLVYEEMEKRFRNMIDSSDELRL